jgi:hypothetical protein
MTTSTIATHTWTVKESATSASMSFAWRNGHPRVMLQRTPHTSRGMHLKQLRGMLQVLQGGVEG